MGFSDRGYYRSEPSNAFLQEWTGVLTIIVANIAVWVAGVMTDVLSGGTVWVNDYLALHGDLPQHLLNAWELVTYGFAHGYQPWSKMGPWHRVGLFDFVPWHLVFNMAAVWFFGREVEEIMGRAEFFRFYMTAIVLAGIAWLVSVQVGQPLQAAQFSLVGASGAVMAVLALFIWYFPRTTVLIWGVLPVPAWALGLLYFVSDVDGATRGGGNVAHVAHIAGAIFGLLYAWRGWNLGGLADMGAAFRRRRMRVVRPDDDRRAASPPAARPREPERLDPDLQEQVDRILEKISRSGESSLTTTERDTLTHASRRLKERSRM